MTRAYLAYLAACAAMVLLSVAFFFVAVPALMDLG